MGDFAALPRRRAARRAGGHARRLPRPDQRHRRPARSGDDARALIPHLDRLALIEVAFPSFRDGRGYSAARILREAGYAGELRAPGDVLVDQIRFMRRCGFDSFAPEAALDRGDAGRARSTRYDDVYQGAADGRGAGLETAAWLKPARKHRPDRRRAALHARPTRSRSTRVSRRRHARRCCATLLARASCSGDVAVVSSFGAESAVLLHLVAQLDPTIPVLFLDTQQDVSAKRSPIATSCPSGSASPICASFTPDPRGARGEGRDRPALVLRSRRLLRDPQGRAAAPRAGRLRRLDLRPQGVPVRDPQRAAALRDRRTAGSRSIRSRDWAKADLDAYFAEHDLPRHPLEAEGYPSIGCAPCTSKVRRAKTRARAAGAAGTRSNAASMSPEKPGEEPVF